MALPKRIITIAYAGLEKHAWKLAIQNRLLWNFQCPHQKQSHQQIFMMLNRQPFFETPEDWHLKFITMLPRISSVVSWRYCFMLNDVTGLKKIYLAAGYTDLRRGMDGLATIIRFRFQLDPYDKNTLFLFCGKKTDRIKGLLWEGDGFLLLYKRLSNGAFNWPRSVEEALEISPEQYTMLMQGLEILPKHPIRLNDPPKRLM